MTIINIFAEFSDSTLAHQLADVANRYFLHYRLYTSQKVVEVESVTTRFGTTFQVVTKAELAPNIIDQIAGFITGYYERLTEEIFSRREEAVSTHYKAWWDKQIKRGIKKSLDEMTWE